jgi:hypothetical protein
VFSGKHCGLSPVPGVPRRFPTPEADFFATFDGETGTRIVTETRASLPAVFEVDDHHRKDLNIGPSNVRGAVLKK